VSFFVDPAIFEDANTRDVVEITLSYTFYADAEATAALAAAAAPAAQAPIDEQS
jgi:cytochrome c oxidase assembly protein Cox11